MIYVDRQLRAWARSGGVEPFTESHVNVASIDLCLGSTFIDLESDTKYINKAEITIKPGDAILATTNEFISMPSNAVGVVYLKSSLARQGLDHALAGYCDCGFKGQLTLELHSHRPITLRAGQRVIQLVLHQTEIPDKTYDGKYQNQRGPTRAR